MKRNLFFIVLVFVLSLSTTLNAQESDFKRYYIGAGASYAIENFQDTNDYDNSFGANGKIGYHLIKDIAVEFNYDYLHEFEKNDAIDKDFDFDDDLEIMTFILGLKGYFPADLEKLKFFVVAGAGVMYVEAGSNHETELCFKAGGGMDFFATEEISIGFEGNYTIGNKDLWDVQYFNFTLGAAFHF